MSEKLGLIEFGRQLLETRDIDPVYILLQEAKLARDRLLDWLLAYWCFYHVGTASYLTEFRSAYWPRMKRAAASKEYPRSPERRHFRGSLAVKSVEWLAERGVDNLFKPLLGTQQTPLKLVINYVKTWYGFGDWIAFKAADMLERLDLLPVQFDGGSLYLFDSPAKGAELAWERYGAGNPIVDKVEWASRTILANLGKRLAPPRYERPINLQETETILCKWHSHMKGHYEVGEDIHACRQGLLRFASSKMSQRLLAAGKVGGLWQ